MLLLTGIRLWDVVGLTCGWIEVRRTRLCRVWGKGNIRFGLGVNSDSVSFDPFIGLSGNIPRTSNPSGHFL